MRSWPIACSLRWPASLPRRLSCSPLGLAVAGKPLCEFAEPFSYFADVLADPALDGWLARLRMVVALKVATRHPGCDELLERLDGVDESPWPELAAALRLAAGAPGCDELLERLDGVDESPWPELAAALVELRSGGPE